MWRSKDRINISTQVLKRMLEAQTWQEAQSCLIVFTGRVTWSQKRQVPANRFRKPVSRESSTVRIGRRRCIELTMVRIAVPNKGRLNQSAIRLMNKIDLGPDASNRTLLAEFGKGRYQILLARAQDILEFVEMGAADMGITGL